MSFWFPGQTDKPPPQSRWSQDQGVDIPLSAHTPLTAPVSGTIVNHGIGGFGQWAPILKLDHPIDGQDYIYFGHAGPGNFTKVGTHVNQGDVLGEVGAGIVGISTGPHLEIGFSDIRGTPVPGTSSTMLSLLKGSSKPKAIGSDSQLFTPGVGALTAASEAGVSPTDPLSLAKDAVVGALSDLWNAIASKAEYAALALVVIVGGFMLIGKGVSTSTKEPASA